MTRRYSHNPFRVLGMARDASRQSITGAVDMRLMELRLAGDEDESHINNVRAAAQELQSPVKRFQHELYWPLLTAEEQAAWPAQAPLADFAQDTEASQARAYEAIAVPGNGDSRCAHNLAVMAHGAALAAEAAVEDGNDEAAARADRLWPDAFARWKTVCDDRDFWELLAHRILAIGDPTLRLDSLEALKRELPAAVLGSAAEFAGQHLGGDRVDRARRLLEHVAASGFDDGAIQKALADACAPAVKRIESACERWEEATREINKSVKEKGEGHSKEHIRESWKRLREDLVAPVEQLRALDPHEPATAQTARDRAAKALREFSVTAFNARRLRKLAQEVLGLASRLAVSQSVQARIEKDKKDLTATEEDDTCAFCDGSSHGNLSEKVFLHRIMEVVQESFGSMDMSQRLDALLAQRLHNPQPKRVRFNTISFQLPRCPECAKVHKYRNTHQAQQQKDGQAATDEGLGGCFLCLLLGMTVPAYYYWQTRTVTGWDFGAGFAICLLLFWIVDVFTKKPDEKPQPKPEPKPEPVKTRPWSTWDEWPRVADLFANGYVRGKEPLDVDVSAYIEGHHGVRAKYSPKPGPRWCRTCHHKMSAPAEHCAHCGGDRLAPKDPRVKPSHKKKAQAKAKEPEPKPAGALGFGSVVWVVILVLATVICLRPTRREIHWRLARHWDSAWEYAGFLRAFPTGKYAQTADTLLDESLWEDAVSMDEYASYLSQHGHGVHATEALEAMHRKRPWTGRRLVSSIRFLRESVRLTGPIEEFLWQRVRAENSVGGYRAYIFPKTFKYHADAERLLEELVWSQAKDPVGWHAYLKQYRNGIHAKEAREKIDDLPWHRAKAKSTERAYRDFLRRYPKHRSAAEARTELAWIRTRAKHRLYEYESFRKLHPGSRHDADALRQIDQILWGIAQRAGTWTEYAKYLEKSPQGAHVAEATAKVESLMWQAAQRGPTRERYASYLARFPQGPHATEATELLREWPWFEALRTDTVEGYQALLASKDAPHAEDARSRIEELPWEEALRAHTVAAYDKYIADNPDTRFTAAARRHRDALAKARDPVKDKSSAFLLRTQGDRVRRSFDVKELQFRQSPRNLPDRLVAMTNVAHKRADSVALLDQQTVVGIVIGHHARAYSTRLLDQHGIINDVVAGVPIAIHYDPVSKTLGAFDRRLGRLLLTFAPTKYVYRGTTLAYDTGTETFWNPVTAEGVAGPMMGMALRWVPLMHTNWAGWRKLHPNTKVASWRGAARQPYRSHTHGRFTAGPVPIPTDHKTQTLIQIVRHDGTYRCYPYPALGTGVVKDGDFEVTWTGVGVHVTHGGQAVPSIRSSWFAWWAFGLQGPVYRKPR